MNRPVAIVGTIVGVVIFGCCGLFGVVGVIGALMEEDDSSSAEDRNDSDDTGEGSGTESSSPEVEDEPDRPDKYLVKRIVDGDTVILDDGEEVRLIGIDAPEDGACGSAKAKELMTSLLMGKLVFLEQPGDNRDKYDRLLRYVDRGTVDVGLKLIQAGLAVASHDSRDGYDRHPRQREYIEADRKAKDIDCTPEPPPAPKPPKPKPPKQNFVDPPSNCEDGYSPCVPQYPPDLDCADTGPVSVTGSDPHGLDADGDGVACGGD